MKKRTIYLAILVLLVLSVSAQALQPYASSTKPSLVFDGTTAVCSATCKGDNPSDAVEATLTLYQGSTFVDSWSASGKYRANVSGECDVQSGKTYTLTVEYSVNGEDMPSLSTTKRCP